MEVLEFDFTEVATPEMRSTLMALLERATTLDDIFEEWFLKLGNRFGLSLAADEDDRVIPNTIEVYFQTGDGEEVLSATISRIELTRMYPQVAPFNIFVKGWRSDFYGLELHEGKYERWLKKLGLTDSFALMSQVGSRSSAIELMVSFALSEHGYADVRHVDPKDSFFEDYDADLAEEGLDLKDFFTVHRVYLQNPSRMDTVRTYFDPIYCRKAA